MTVTPAGTAPAGVPTFRPPRPLGVGCAVRPDRLDLLDRVRHLVDLVEVSPARLSQQRPTTGGGLRTSLLPAVVDRVLGAAGDLAVVTRGAGLSIGSAAGWDHGAADLLEDVGRRCGVRWHSEALGFAVAAGIDGRRRHAGTTLPLPHTAEAAALVADRVRALQARIGRPVLLAAVVSDLADVPADPGWDEARFLGEVCRRSGCGLLLDVDALLDRTDATTADAWHRLGALPMERVVELRVGGGERRRRIHDGDRGGAPQPVREAVWSLAEHVLARAPHVAALVVDLGVDPVSAREVAIQVEEVDRAVDRWHWCRRPPGAEAPAPGLLQGATS